MIPLTAVAIAAFHIGAAAALFIFSWKALALAILLWWVSGSLGIGMGYHRLLTHRGYKTPRRVEYFVTGCGTGIIATPSGQRTRNTAYPGGQLPERGSARHIAAPGPAN